MGNASIDRINPLAKEKIATATLNLLAEKGYNDFKVNDVAVNAHVSLTTIYKLYSTREELIAVAVSHWAEENIFSKLSGWAPESLHDLMSGLLQIIFEPLEKEPWMTKIYHRAMTGRANKIVRTQYFRALDTLAKPYFYNLDAAYIEDLDFILGTLLSTTMAEISNGTRSPRQAMELLQRAVYRLTHNNEKLTRAANSPMQLQSKSSANVLSA